MDKEPSTGGWLESSRTLQREPEPEVQVYKGPPPSLDFRDHSFLKTRSLQQSNLFFPSFLGREEDSGCGLWVTIDMGYGLGTVGRGGLAAQTARSEGAAHRRQHCPRCLGWIQPSTRMWRIHEKLWLGQCEMGSNFIPRLDARW